jgi:hypothetical protein
MGVLYAAAECALIVIEVRELGREPAFTLL